MITVRLSALSLCHRTEKRAEDIKIISVTEPKRPQRKKENKRMDHGEGATLFRPECNFLLILLFPLGIPVIGQQGANPLLFLVVPG